jgi:chromate transport protein ChrA
VTAAPPPRGLVGIGIGGLSLEAIVLLLATPAVTTAERGHVTPWHVGYLLTLVVLLAVAAVLLARRKLRWPGTVVQVLTVAAGVVTWPLYVVGALFAGVWLYYLRLWRTSDRPPFARR